MWYVVQVETGHEERACSLIRQVAEISGLSDAFDELFVPKRRIMAPVGGGAQSGQHQGQQPSTKEVPLFPGYLIAVAKRDAVGQIAGALRRTPAFAKLLAYDGVFAALAEDEVRWICAFTQRERRIVEVSEGFVERGCVTVVAGPLVGKEAQIVKVNRRKRTARVKFSICGRTVETELALNLMKENKSRCREALRERERGSENE